MCVRPFVRSSVRHAHRIRLNLVTRNGLLPLVQRSSTPKTDRFEDDRHAHRIIVIEIELLRSSSSVASVVGFSILSISGHPALRVLSSNNTSILLVSKKTEDTTLHCPFAICLHVH